MNQAKKFSMIDEDFVCEVCNENIKKLKYTARNHCPHCLNSKHVDKNPGDRLENCGGILKPVAIEKSKKRDYKIVFICEKCGVVKKNIVANDDNMNLIIKIMSEPSNLLKPKKL